MSRKTAPVNEKVEAAIAEIERRYAIGQAILETCGPSLPAGLIKEQARKYGINRDSCQKLRAMAAPETPIADLRRAGLRHAYPTVKRRRGG